MVVVDNFVELVEEGLGKENHVRMDLFFFQGKLEDLG